MKFIENTKINFMALKNAGFTVSGIMATGSIILLLMGINLGIDFKGGTMIGLNFSEEVNIEEIRNVMKAIPSDGQVVDLSTEEIKHFGSTDDVMIKVKTRDNVSPDFAQDNDRIQAEHWEEDR